MKQQLFYFLLINLGISLSFFSCKTVQDTVFAKETVPVSISTASFNHGVASGDPLNDRVIIWTRVTPNKQEALTVEWIVATDENMETPIESGVVQTNQNVDYTVKVDVTGLNPNTTYYYQFKTLGTTSIVGRTKTTAKQGVDAVKLAIISWIFFVSFYISWHFKCPRAMRISCSKNSIRYIFCC